jgi:hypothetical protein
MIKDTIYPASANDRHSLEKILKSVTGWTEVIWQTRIGFFAKFIKEMIFSLIGIV